jgi:RNA polymerase sigma-70 factor (ECF subfamily)
MEDSRIVDLYWERSETAIYETQLKYGHYCFSIANNILPFREDAEESVNDTYMAAWNAMPPNRPSILSTFLGKLTRRISIDRWRNLSADKRGGGTVPIALEELAECIPGTDSAEAAAEETLLIEVLNRFLADLPTEKRKLFLRRYWYLCSVKEIAEDFGLGESNVKMTLLRLREQLKSVLEKEGITL